MRERVLSIGRPSPLIGVATEPSSFEAGRPVLLILNSGIMHHVGSCRLSVKLARAVAEKGFLAVRFDFSGIGDSEPRNDSASFEEISQKECSEVMDYVQTTWGSRKFILFGLCSGANVAYHTSLSDERVAGFIQIDGHHYPTLRSLYRGVTASGLRIASASRWKHAFRRWKSGGRFLSRPGDQARSPQVDMPAFTPLGPSREVMSSSLRTLVGREVGMYFIFTGDLRTYNYPTQFADAFKDVDFRSLLRVDYLPQANHTITQIEYQRLVVSKVESWVAEVDSGMSPSARPR